jgi:hypothetical protein
MSDLYTLDPDGNPVVSRDVSEWGAWMQTADRQISKSYFSSIRYGMIGVSTVFLGVDHSFAGSGRAPVLFETMIFREKGTDEDDMPPPDDLVAVGFWGEMRRYATRAEAVAGHRAICQAMSSVESLGNWWKPI